MSSMASFAFLHPGVFCYLRCLVRFLLSLQHIAQFDLPDDWNSFGMQISWDISMTGMVIQIEKEQLWQLCNLQRAI